MRIEYHPAVEQDVAEALRRYDSVSLRLGEDFKAELRRFINVAAAKPERFSLVLVERPTWPFSAATCRRAERTRTANLLMTGPRVRLSGW